MADKYSFYPGDQEFSDPIEEKEPGNGYPEGHLPVRYRCKQVNVTKIGGVPTFNSDIRKEYIVDYVQRESAAYCKLQDYVFQADPKDFELPLEEMKPLEYAKEDVSFQISDMGTLTAINNFRELQQRWKAFREDFIHTLFYQDIKNVNEKAAADILNAGDKEFAKESSLLKSYDKNLFYHVLFKDYRPSNTNDSLFFLSQIFHDVSLEVPIVHTKALEEEDALIYRSVGELNREKINRNEMIRQYDAIYKPVIKYNFTEYDYEYRIRRKIDRKTGIITSARAILIESVKNNYELISQFDLKQIPL